MKKSDRQEKWLSIGLVVAGLLFDQWILTAIGLALFISKV